MPSPQQDCNILGTTGISQTTVNQWHFKSKPPVAQQFVSVLTWLLLHACPIRRGVSRETHSPYSDQCSGPQLTSLTSQEDEGAAPSFFFDSLSPIHFNSSPHKTHSLAHAMWLYGIHQEGWHMSTENRRPILPTTGNTKGTHLAQQPSNISLHSCPLF